MRILIFHGYLLGGTGSNVYNALLAKALVELGHDVHLLAQERHPEQHSFIDAAGDWDAGDLRVASSKEASVRCTLYRPAIGGLLPVYVEDRYEGVEARAFLRCSDAELQRYLDANVAAVAEVSELVRPHLALANHVLMGPTVLARALGGQVPYAVKVHGSALEYTLKRDLGRFLPFAEEGLAGAEGVLVGSYHTAESLYAALGPVWVQEHQLRQRTRLGPPGVDVHAFGPRSARQAQDGLRTLALRLETETAQAPVAHAGATTGADAGDPERADAGDTESTDAGDAFARDEAAIARAVSGIAAGDGPLVAYVGKLIVSKGVDLLIAAWPLVLEQAQDARLAIVGFGSLRPSLERLLSSLGEGDMDAVRRFAQAGRGLEGGPPGPLKHLLSFLDSLDGERLERYLRAACALPQQVSFTGRLDHRELAELLPACESLVVPSTFPEAFGMVAVEAAACGALPVSAAHSGLAEVSAELAKAVSAEVAPLLSFEVGPGAVEAIAHHLTRWLALDRSIRAQARSAIVEAVRDRWSWEGVAAGVIAAATASAPAAPTADR